MRTYKFGAVALAALMTIGAGCATAEAPKAAEQDSSDASAIRPEIEVTTRPAGETTEAGLEIDTAPSEETSGAVKSFTVIGGNFSFDLKEMKVKKGDKVKVTFKNAEGFHDWKLDEFSAATPRLQAGQEATIEFTADKTGTFEYYCSVGTHRAMGMKGTLIVQ